MTKDLKKMSLIAIAIMMIAGGFMISSGKNLMPRKAMADITETMPDTGSDEIVAGNEEVPL